MRAQNTVDALNLFMGLKKTEHTPRSNNATEKKNSIKFLKAHIRLVSSLDFGVLKSQFTTFSIHFNQVR